MVIVDAVENASKPTAVPSATSEPVTAENETLLDFPIQLIDGSTTNLRAHQGQTVLLVFFSVNCGHCHNESSHLEAMYQEFKDQDFIILSAEVSGAAEDKLQEFAGEYSISFPLGADSNAQFARYMGVSGVPHNFLIGPDGNVINEVVGFRDEATLRDVIKEALSNQ
jgi:peroxiredoxin